MTISLLEKKGYNPLSYRFMCLQSHYRNQLVFSYDSLNLASISYDKLKNKIKSLKTNEDLLNKELVKKYIQNFKETLMDDLNTSNALTVLFEVIKNPNLNDYSKLYLVNNFDKVLSLDLINEEKSIDKDLLNKINMLIEKRNVAKKEKNYELADKIREELLKMNVSIKDTREGTIFEII